MITPYERPNYAKLYEHIITSEQNPVEIWFPYREEAFRFQQGFYIGLEPHNEYILSDIKYRESNKSSYKYVLSFWI